MGTKYVSLGSISRNGNKFTVKHSCTKAHKKAISYVRLQWKIDGSKKDTTIEHKKLTKNNANDSITVTRGNYNPSGSHGKLVKVSVRAIGRVYDSKKKTYVNKGSWSSWVSFTMSAPSKPTVTCNTDPDTGHVSFKIETAHPSNSASECKDTAYVVKQSGTGVKAATLKDTSNSSTDFTTAEFDMSRYTSLPFGKYIKVSCVATARGFGGNASAAESSHIFARPNPPTIKSIDIQKLNGNLLTGVVIVSFSLDKANGTAPVDTVQLWRLQSEVSTKIEAYNAPGWEAVSDSVDDGDVSGLSDPVADAMPVAPGTHVWYRVSAKRDNLTTYSDPFECADLYVAKTTTSTGTVELAALNAGDGWVRLSVEDSETDDDCVRVSWADFEDAWNSTEQPNSFDVDWLDEGKATVYVRGLENGTRYWFRARAVDTDSDGKEVLGGLSAAVEAIPSSDFGTVSVSAPTNVGIGEPLDVSWAFSSDMEQESASVSVGDSTAASISGSGTTATIPASMLERYSGATATITVSVSAGGSTFSSEPVSVIVADTPSCAVTSATLTKQPLSFEVATDSPNSPQITAYVISHGCTGSGLDGDAPQYEGDCIWSGQPDAIWELSNGLYRTNITLPEGLAFWDGGIYTVAATLHDPVTGLDSSEASCDVAVAWAHQADMPTGSVTVDGLTAIVTVNAPVADDEGDGYVQGDRFDLYRVTPDGERRIASNLPFGTSVTDRFAPFGKGANLRYLAVTRTVDGDWSPSEDIVYSIDHAGLRFDWGLDESLELDYNIEDSFSFDKGFESDTTLGGENVGWWDGSSQRKASLKTDLIKLQSADQEEALASIAGHPGPVFVRTGSGVAFPANVVPSDVSRSYLNRTVSVSLDCTEVALTAEHMPGEADIALPAWGGGALHAVNGVVFDTAGGFPMDDWTFLGYSGKTLFAVDPDGAIMDGDAATYSDYSWDGETLRNAQGVAIPLSEVAS